MNNIKKVFQKFSSTITALIAMVAIFGFFTMVTPAFAGVGGSVVPDYPSPVTVGQTGLSASIAITNGSTNSNSTESVSVTDIITTPSCGFGTSRPCSAPYLDPGVFNLNNGIGRAGTACAGVVFTAGAPDGTTGEIIFTPSSPITLGPSNPGGLAATCTIDFTVDVLKAPTIDSESVLDGIQTRQFASADFRGLSSILPGAGSGTSQVTITKATPEITTIPSAGGVIGTILNDTATLFGGSSPTGSVTFKLFDPTDEACSATPVFTEIDVLSPYATTGGYTSLVAGTYRWTADYAGDANNNPAFSGCQEEQVEIIPNGHIIIDKITNPTGDLQSFDFTTTGTGYNNFSLTDGSLPNDQELNAGTYSVSEIAVLGWDQTSVTCVSSNQDVETPESISLQAGETVTCTFTNGKIPTLTLEKTVVNDNGGNAVEADFQAYINGDEVAWDTTIALDPGTYTATENVLAGYTAGNWGGDCGIDGSVTLAYGETKTCTITNDDILMTGNIIVDKVTLPAGHTQSFSFDAIGGDYADFSLTDLALPNNQELVAGIYSLVETLPSGWVQTSATCVSSNQDIETPASISLQAGETVTCTFVNTKLNPDIDIEKATNGQDADTMTGPIVTEGDPIAWTYVVTNTGDVSLTDIVVTDDQGVIVTCPKSTLAIGESMTCTANGVAIVGQYSNIGSVEGHYEDILVEDSDPSHYYGEKKEIQWCSPGYWRQPHHLGSWGPTGYSQDDYFLDSFPDYVFPTVKKNARIVLNLNPTLMEVLQSPQIYGGEAFNMVGDLLSDAHPDVNFEMGDDRIEDSCSLGRADYTPTPPPVFLLGTLSAEDFGVVNYEVSGELGTLTGYTAGFAVVDNTLAGATSVVVKLYTAGDVLLQTNTAIFPKFNDDITGTQFSSPFDVSGTFNYVTDGYWTNVREAEYGQSVPATKVVATVTLANGKIVIATNTNLTGDPTMIYPVAIANVTTNPATLVTSTGATVNGTNGPSNATNTSFWLGTTVGGPFTASATPGSQLPAGWTGVASGAQLANAPFSYAYTGLTSGTTYHFVAWSLVGGIWYPGAVLDFTTL